MKVLIFFALLTIFFITKGSKACPEIVTRAGWGARPPKKSIPMKVPVAHVFIHHTVGNKCQTKAACIKEAKNLQNYHMNRNGWDDIGYSFLVGGDGRIYEGCGWKREGSHTKNYNSRAIGISFMGNFDKEKPHSAMIIAARNLIDCGVKNGFITRNRQIHGHRDARCTKCPGDALYKIIQGWVGFKKGRLPGYVCPKKN